MKRLLTPLLLFTLAFGCAQLPALADFNLNYGDGDRNHDNRWNYNEFQHANHYYYEHHHGARVSTDSELRHNFDKLDRNRDGYINVDEARSYRNWD